MHIVDRNIDRRARRGAVGIQGDTFRCRLETDWSTEHRGAYPRFCEFLGRAMPCLKFGFAAPWDWILDLDATEAVTGVVVSAQGYRELKGGRIPFQRCQRFFWRAPEMLYETTETRHLKEHNYLIAGVTPDALRVDPRLARAVYRRDGVEVCWQFSPTPVAAQFRADSGGWVFEFDSPVVEALVQWGVEGTEFPRFHSLSPELNTVRANGPRGSRSFAASEKHQCLEPDESLVLPDGECMVTVDPAKPGSALMDLALRRQGSGSLALGACRVFALERLVETPSFPMFKPYLVRALRSLKERMVFGVVPEDDTDQPYQWGTGTWPRCLSVLSLDRFGFYQEAFAYLEFMLDASRQFVPVDGLPHLWDNFYITGPKWNDRLYDINAHAMKLFEAGKLHLRHRHDDWGRRLREEHYGTLRGWCQWIERHMEPDGAVVDETESNIWAHGFGTFSQAPAAAGVKLFAELAAAAGRDDDAAHFAQVAQRLVDGLNTRLWGDAANSYLDIPEGTGECYLNYLPRQADERNWWDQPVKRIGLSCYSLAASYFLQDPDVALLPQDDPRAAATLDLALRHLGDPFEPLIPTWHIRRKEAHMGYGPGQLLNALLYTGRGEEFRRRLAALFEVSTREVGDVYLMQEVLGRVGFPNRGNKAALSYFPFLAASLAGFDAPGLGDRAKNCLPDLVALAQQGVSGAAQ